MADLPFIDTHSQAAEVTPDALWASLESFAARIGFRGSLLPRIWGTVPARGFEITESVPGHSLTLSGRHRFSHYQLIFALDAGPGGRPTVLHATTCAAFPGLHGRIYRLCVIKTGLHVLATRQVLRTIINLA